MFFSSLDFSVLPTDTLTGQDLLQSRGHGLHIYCSLWHVYVILNFRTLIESGEKLITFKVMRFCSVARHYKISGTRRVGIQKVSMDKPNIFNLSLKNILDI